MTAKYWKLFSTSSGAEAHTAGATAIQRQSGHDYSVAVSQRLRLPKAVFQVASRERQKWPTLGQPDDLERSKNGLQKSLARVVLEQRCIANIAEQHFDLLLPRDLLHLRQ